MIPALARVVLLRNPLGFSSSIAALGVQSDGKIVVAGQTTDRIWGHTELMLARFQPDGILDPAFGSRGIVTTRMSLPAGVSDLALQPDGMILVAATHGIARYRTNGIPDAAFGTNGVVGPGFPAFTPNAVALQQDGRIVAAGSRQGRTALR